MKNLVVILPTTKIMYWFLIISIYCENNNTVILLTVDFDIQIYLYLFSEWNFVPIQFRKTEYLNNGN